jgi:ectoine hydroxylase-related dioxygenase (phytanoyl-CoA dioxygenase family)
MQSSDTAASKEGFNRFTVDWFDPEFRLELGRVADYDARPEDVETFRRDGVVRLRGVFADWVEPLRAGLARNLADPHAFAFPVESTRPGAPGRFFDSYCNWQRIPEYARFVERSCAAAMAGRFMGSEVAQYFHEHVFVKEPGTQAATPWHQDLPYYCVDGRKSVSIYIALDPIAEAWAVRFATGSHLWPRLCYPRVFLDGTHFNTEDATLQPMPDIDGDLERYPTVGWDLAPGDAILFNFRTAHGATATEVGARRRAFVTRWMGDDMTYCERPGEISPPYENHGMKDGERMREDWFPILWRKGQVA